MPVIVSTEELAKEQQQDEKLVRILSGQTSLRMKKLRLDDTDTTIYCEVTDDIRIYVPATLRRKIFNTVHKMSHPGTKATRKLIKRKFI